MKQKKLGFLFIIIIGSIAILASVAWVFPKALSLYYQVKGGRLLNQALFASESSSQYPFACDALSINTLTEKNRLTLARQNLQKSIGYDPGASQAYLLLGRIECLLGEPTSAVQWYIKYVQLRPKNPLGYLELGFAFANLCINETRDVSKESLCGSNYLQQSIFDELRLAGIGLDSLISEANQAFSSHRYSQAVRWYYYASLMGDIPDKEKFRWSIAEIISGHDLPHISGPDVLNIQPLGSDLEIDASTFQWMIENRLGKTIGNPTTGDPHVGYLTFQGTAITVIDVQQLATYHVTINAQNSTPPPIQIQLEIDLQPYASFELSRGDGSWEELSTDITLNAGYHVLGINFVNDAVINGVDRNAIIEWVKLLKK
jgi:hypothetical protein